MNTSDQRQVAIAHGLSEDEYDRILRALNREPNLTELGVISAMWSEHCSYKSSRIHLVKLPSRGEQVVHGPGENAGVVDIGGGLVAVFKMESHNHPSYIEPYQGAATGVGGILRDIFTMGARPIASLNSLRFGETSHERTPYLFRGVVEGIADYGNKIGVPTVGGEVFFDASYNGNILVNAFTVGVCKKEDIFLGVASGVGSSVYYVGAATGRDGIHGAAMASEQFDEASEQKRPVVQTGDPFREKVLLEACMELMRTGIVIGIQDMGAAGLTSSSVEMADRGNLGIRIDVDQIPVRESGMNAYEMLLSESQERMLIVVKSGQENTVAQIFEKWELAWAKIGEVILSRSLEVYERGEMVCNLPIELLTSDAPRYDRPRARPGYLNELSESTTDELNINQPAELGQALVTLLGSPNICSRAVVYEQFDSGAGNRTVAGPGEAGAAVLRVYEGENGHDRAIAITTHCNSRFCFLDPREGAKLAVAQCARNLSCVGATPLAVTDCLNFGDPNNPEVMWQLVESIEGIAQACVALNTPVVSGNVSLYNSSFGRDIFPTPAIAMLGAFEHSISRYSDDTRGFCGGAFRTPGDQVVLLGVTEVDELGGSEYLWIQCGKYGKAPPRLNLEREYAVQALVRRLIRSNFVQSAQSVGAGGAGVALAKCCIRGPGLLGLTIEMKREGRSDLFLFSESPSRVVVSAREEKLERVCTEANAAGVPYVVVGTVTRAPRLVWEDFDIPTGDLFHSYIEGLNMFLS